MHERRRFFAVKPWHTGSKMLIAIGPWRGRISSSEIYLNACSPVVQEQTGARSDYRVVNLIKSGTSWLSGVRGVFMLVLPLPWDLIRIVYFCLIYLLVNIIIMFQIYLYIENVIKTVTFNLIINAFDIEFIYTFIVYL